MKTRKEQIDEMANIIKADYKQWLDITGVFPEGSSYYFECLGGGEDCAELLYNAGYGDVSEYKAEIERLKAENEKMRKERGYINQLKEELLLKHYNVDCYQEEIKKQAQIDVLNELKKYLHTEDFDTPDERWKPESEFCAIIDELIKDVQNG